MGQIERNRDRSSCLIRCDAAVLGGWLRIELGMECLAPSQFLRQRLGILALDVGRLGLPAQNGDVVRQLGPVAPGPDRSTPSGSSTRSHRSWSRRSRLCRAAAARSPAPASTLAGKPLRMQSCWSGGRLRSCRGQGADWLPRTAPQCHGRSPARSAAMRTGHWNSCRSAKPASAADGIVTCRPPGPPRQTPPAEHARRRPLQNAPDHPPAATPSDQAAGETPVTIERNKRRHGLSLTAIRKRGYPNPIAC